MSISLALCELHGSVMSLPDGTYTDANGNSLEVTAQIQARASEIVASENLTLLRTERNQRLANTDWWASSDLTMTAEQTAYRQALRDITDTYTSLDDVVWPEKP